jgi:hypothetical protein
MKQSDLKAEAERLIAAGEMPSLQELMEAIESVRADYLAKIKAARKAADSSRQNPRQQNQYRKEP